MTNSIQVNYKLIQSFRSNPKLVLYLSFFLFVYLLSATGLLAQRVQDDSKGLIVHDPVMMKQDSIYYLFMTHGGVAKSSDLENWTRIDTYKHIYNICKTHQTEPRSFSGYISSKKKPLSYR